MASRGYVYVAFGSEYARQAAYSAFYLRKHTDLPIAVATNVEKHDEKWEDVSDVRFIFFDRSDDDNRRFKIRPDTYSPFDETAFLDTDTETLSSDVEKIFDILEEFDIAFPPHVVYDLESNRPPNVYAKVVERFSCSYPLQVYQSGAYVFRKSPFVTKVFKKWCRVWQKAGRGRDMPCLACAVQLLKTDKVGLLSDDLYGKGKSTVVRHYGKHYSKVLPKIRKYKPFIQGDDWVRI